MKFTVLFLLIFLPTAGFSPEAQARDKRAQVIDFEDDMIRGVSKRPYDSLSQISDKNGGKNRAHLYRKRAGFKYDTERTLKELRLVQ